MHKLHIVHTNVHSHVQVLVLNIGRLDTEAKGIYGIWNSEDIYKIPREQPNGFCLKNSKTVAI